MLETHDPNKITCICSDDRGNEVKVEEDISTKHHAIELKRLTPETTCEYSIFREDSMLHTSHFHTMPEGDYRVVLVGDMHSPIEGFSSLVTVIEESDPDFIVLLGDMVCTGDDRQQWIHFFNAGRNLFDHIPIFPVRGDHDVGEYENADFYGKYFCDCSSESREQYYYSRVISDDLYIFLDSETNSLRSATWLLGTLFQAKRLDYGSIFIVSHKGVVSFKGDRAGNTVLKFLLPFCDYFGITAFFSGHDHHYIRGVTLFNTPFFISGGGGG